jgi:hypothetical protein
MLSPMKKLLAIIAMGLFLTTPSQANDVSEFQIEGISIGDSLLDYYSKDEILLKKQKPVKEQKSFDYISFLFKPPRESEYQFISFVTKKNDNNYIIAGIRGIIDYKNNIEDCFKKQIEISKEISKLFFKAPLEKRESTTILGKNKYEGILLENGQITINCIDYFKDYKDHLSVSVSDLNYPLWLTNNKF